MNKMTEEEVNRLAKEQQDKALDHLISTQSALWSALLSANGIVLGALSIIVALRVAVIQSWSLWVFGSSIVITTIAILLILYCFRSERDHHHGRLNSMANLPASWEEFHTRKQEETKKTLRRHHLRKWFERIATATLIVNLILVIIAVAL